MIMKLLFGLGLTAFVGAPEPKSGTEPILEHLKSSCTVLRELLDHAHEFPNVLEVPEELTLEQMFELAGVNEHLKRSLADLQGHVCLAGLEIIPDDYFSWRGL